MSLTPEQALEIFRRRTESTARSTALAETAQEFGVTRTAIRHIWGRLTWKATTMPLWTEEERASGTAGGLCQQCLDNGAIDLSRACPACPINRKRGRPVGTKDSYKRQRSAPVGGAGGAGGQQSWERQPHATWRPDADADELRSLPPAAAGSTVRGTLTVAGRGLCVRDVSSTLRNVFSGGAVALQGQSLWLFLHPATAHQLYDALEIARSTGATSQVVHCYFLVPVQPGGRGAVGAFLPCSVHGTPTTEGLEEFVLSVEAVLANDSESPGTASGSVRVRHRGGVDYSDMSPWTGSYTVNKLESTATLATIAMQLGHATRKETSIKKSWMVGRWVASVWGFAQRAAERLSLGWLLDASGLENAILDSSVFGVEFWYQEAVQGGARGGQAPSASCPTAVKFSIEARNNVFGIPKRMLEAQADARTLCGTMTSDSTISSDPQSMFRASSFWSARPCSFDAESAGDKQVEAADKCLVDLKFTMHKGGGEPRMRGYAILVFDFVEIPHRKGFKRMHVYNTIIPPEDGADDEPGAAIDGNETWAPSFSSIIFDEMDQMDA